MNKKKTTGVVLAVVLFIITCACSMSMNMANNILNNSMGPSASGGTGNILPRMQKYVAKMYISGEMAENATSSYFETDTITYNHEYIMNYVNELIADDNNVALLLVVNSPGGYVYMADELYCRLNEYKATGRPIYCFFDNMAASGAYYAAMSADEIYAKKMNVTGSIGVIMSTYNLSGLFEKYGIEEVVIKSAANKGAGSIGTPWTEEQLAIEQAMVDEYYGYFVDAVVAGRNLPREEVLRLADGRAYTAQQALDNKLIDGIMDYSDYENKVMSNFASDVIVYEAQTATDNPLSSIFGQLTKQKPKSDLQVLQEFSESLESGVPKYETTY